MNLDNSSSFTVIGSGFGLYGYLPALVLLLNKKVILPIAYKEKVDSRVELSVLSDHVTWVEDQETALSKASSLIIATPPLHQEAYIEKYLSYRNINKIILEKPIARTPEKSIELLFKLDKFDKKYLISYSFFYLKWYESLKWPINTNKNLYINWTFMSHHFKNEINNWKRFHSQGGGVLRFYGIHIVAMLADIGYTSIEESYMSGETYNEPDCWKAIFSGLGLPDCEVIVNSRAASENFSIGYHNHSLVKLKCPFAEETNDKGYDCRIRVLANEITGLETSTKDSLITYRNINALWYKIEQITIMTFNNRVI